jgi:predicted restriction endonuclease
MVRTDPIAQDKEREYHHQYYLDHLDKFTKGNKDYYQQHKAKLVLAARKRRKKYPEMVREIDLRSKQKHSETIRVRVLQHRHKYITRDRARDKAYNQVHRQSRTEYARHYRNANRAKIAQQNKQNRALVLEHYGSRCACCGEAHQEFLCVDHINGGGNQHRKLLHLMPGGQMYRWLIRNNFPEGFRLLCWNCNSSLGMRGYCPHQQEKESGGIVWPPSTTPAQMLG